MGIKKTRNRFKSLLLLLLLCLTLMACTDGGSDNGKIGVSGVVREEETPSPITEEEEGLQPVSSERFLVTGTLNDAKTGAPIDSETRLKVIGGENVSIVDSLGNSQSQFNLEQGVVTFYVRGASPTEENPLRLTLVGEKTGYFSSSSVVSIASEGDADFVMNLVKIDENDPPAGVVIKTDNVSSGLDGKITAEKEVKTAAAPGTEGTTVTIPAETIFADKDGPISGDLNINVTYQGAGSTESLSTFPGGVGDVEVAGDQTATDPAFFVSGGFTSIEITDENGRQVTNFKDAVGDPKEISLSMTIPDTTTNMDGQLLSKGNVVPIWSYEPDTGEWTSEQDGEVTGVDAANNKLIVSFKATHLSYWNMDWKGSRCRKGKRINLTTDGEPNTHPTFIKITRQSGGGYLFTWSPRYYDGAYDYSFIQMLNTPRNIPMNIEVFFKNISMDDSMITIPISNLCEPGELNQNIVLKDPPQFYDLDVQVNQIVASGTTGMPSTSVYYRVNGTGPWKYSGQTNNSGLLTIPQLVEFENAQSFYRVYVYDRFNSKWATQDITLSADSRSLEFNFGLIGFVLANGQTQNQFEVGGKTVEVAADGRVSTPSTFQASEVGTAPEFTFGMQEIGDVGEGTYSVRVGIDVSNQQGMQAKLLLDRVDVVLKSNQLSVHVPAGSKTTFEGISRNSGIFRRSVLNEQMDVVLDQQVTNKTPFPFDPTPLIDKITSKLLISGVSYPSLTQTGSTFYTFYIESSELSFGTVQNSVFQPFTRTNQSAFVVWNDRILPKRAFMISGEYRIN